VLPLDPKSHIPIMIRQHIVEQCFEQYCRIYASREDAVVVATRFSLEAEQELFRKSHSKHVYRSIAVNLIQQLRKTSSTHIISDSITLQQPNQGTQSKSNMQKKKHGSILFILLTILFVLLAILDYTIVSNYVLSLKDLYQNDFPLDIIMSDIEIFRHKRFSNDVTPAMIDIHQHRCDRCGVLYSEKREIDPEECKYHPNRAFVDTSFGHHMGEVTKIYACCGKSLGSQGCSQGSHVFSIDNFADLKNRHVFIMTQPYPGDFQKDQKDQLKCLAVDCEMVSLLEIFLFFFSEYFHCIN
jgi:hypothetical protein